MKKIVKEERKVMEAVGGKNLKQRSGRRKRERIWKKTGMYCYEN